MRWVAAALAGIVMGVAMNARAAEPVLRVRGQATIDATAGWLDGHLIVSGSIRDDTGRALAGAALTLSARAANGKPAELPQGVPCSPLAEADKVPRGDTNERSLRSDRSGRFCVDFETSSDGSFAGAPEPPLDVELRYSDARQLFDPASRRVLVERNRRGVELRFVEPPTTIDLDASIARIEVGLRAEPPVPSTGGAALPLVLVARADGKERVVAQLPCRLGGTTQFSVATSELGAPGPVDLIARFSGTDSFQPAEAVRRVSRIARVTLSVGSPPEPSDPENGVTLDLAVGSSRGAVNSGAVEARIGGETAGIARVESGTVRVVARFARRAERTAELTLHYLPSEPWWTASAPLRVEVPLAPQSHWGSVAWLIGSLVIAFWLLRGWRRPAPPPRSSATVASKARAAAVVVVEPDAGSAGWRGIVRDAHDRTPVAQAEVAIVADEADGARVVARTTTDTEGHFELPSVSADAEKRFVVTARWHALLRVAVPPHGRLEIDLVTRRRQLVARFVAWASREGHGMKGRSEPTPGDVRDVARRVRRQDIIDWANAVEKAAYGPEPVDEPVERRVVEREPPERGRPSNE
jgi:hypothetical protein